MIVKGIIKSIDFKGNTCTVRIPVFESAANNGEVVVPAVLSTIPGLYNGYKVGDVVFVGFENDQLNSPVVISKLYLGAEKEGKTPRGAVNIESFKASESISIPVDTRLTLNNDPNKLSTVKVKNSVGDYKTIADVIKGLQVQKEQIGSLDVQIVDNGKELGAKVNKTQDAQTTGFGWNLTDDSWVLQAYNSEHGFKYTDIFKATQEGVEVTGTIKVKDFPRYTRTTYTITDDDVKPTVKPWDNTYNDPANPPRAPWSLVEPEQTIGKRLWVATTVWVYTLNETTQELEESVETTIQDGALLRYTYYYKQVQQGDPAPEKPDNNTIPTEASGWAALVPEKDSTKDTYRCTQILEDDDDPQGIRHITYTELIPLDANALVVEQGKSTTYYSDTDPCELGYNVKYGDCWVDTNSAIGNLLHIDDYIGKYIKLPNANTYTYILVTGENINTPTIYNFLNNWLPQTVIQIQYVIDESTGERIEPAAFHPEDYFVKLDYTFIDLLRTPIMYKEDIQAYGRSSIDSEDRFVYIGYILDPEFGILDKWRKQNTNNNQFVDTDFVVYTNNITGSSPSSPFTSFTVTQEQLDDNIRVAAIAYEKEPAANYLKQWVGDHWEDVGGEIIANKVTAEYINAKDIIAKKIEVQDSTNTKILFKADGLPGTADTDKVQIAGFKVDENTLYSDTNTTPKPGDASSVFVSRGATSDQDIAGSSADSQTNDWAFSASDDFGVTTDGKLYTRDASIAGEISADKLWINNVPLVNSSSTPINSCFEVYVDNVVIVKPHVYQAEYLEISVDIKLKNALKVQTPTIEATTVTINFFVNYTAHTGWGNVDSVKMVSDTITIPAGSDDTFIYNYVNNNLIWLSNIDTYNSGYITFSPSHIISPTAAHGNLRNETGYFLDHLGACTKTYYIRFKDLQYFTGSSWWTDYDNREKYAYACDIFANASENHYISGDWSTQRERYTTAILDIGNMLLKNDFEIIYGITAQIKCAPGLVGGACYFSSVGARADIQTTHDYPIFTNTFEGRNGGLYIVYSRKPWCPTSDTETYSYNSIIGTVPTDAELYDRASNQWLSNESNRLSDHLPDPYVDSSSQGRFVYYGVECEFEKEYRYGATDEANRAYADGVFVTVYGKIK